MPDGSLDFGQRKDVFHQLCHFGACEIFDLRGKTLNRAAQIAKAVGALGAFAFLQILLSVLQTLQLVLLLCKLRLSSFLFGSKLIEGFRSRRLSEAQDSPLLLLPPTVPGSDCIVSITANTATTPARAA